MQLPHLPHCSRIRVLTPKLGGATVLVLGGLSALLAGCSTPSRPPANATAYVLVEVNGEELPATYLRNDFGRLVVHADTIWLDNRGSGFRHAILRRENAAAAGDSVQELREDFRYRVEDRRLTLTFPCPGFFSLALCAAPPHGEGVLEADRLRLTYLIGAQGPLVYHRRD